MISDLFSLAVTLGLPLQCSSGGLSHWSLVVKEGQVRRFSSEAPRCTFKFFKRQNWGDLWENGYFREGTMNCDQARCWERINNWKGLRVGGSMTESTSVNRSEKKGLFYTFQAKGNWTQSLITDNYEAVYIAQKQPLWLWMLFTVIQCWVSLTHCSL